MTECNFLAYYELLSESKTLKKKVIVWNVQLRKLRIPIYSVLELLQECSFQQIRAKKWAWGDLNP